jgi:hypothetical protein
MTRAKDKPPEDTEDVEATTPEAEDAAEPSKTGAKTRAAKTKKKEEPRAKRRDTTVRIVIEGDSPLMTDHFPEAEAISALIEGERGGERETDGQKIAKKKVYVDGEGIPIIPTTALFACFREGGRSVVISGRTKVSTSTSTMLSSRVRFLQEYVPILIPDDDGGWRPATMEDWEQDFKTVKMGTGKAKTTQGTFRPKWMRWRLELDVVFREGMNMRIESFYQAIEAAGRDAGLGSFRPSCNGVYGMFHVEVFDAVRSVAVSGPRILNFEPREKVAEPEAVAAG